MQADKDKKVKKKKAKEDAPAEEAAAPAAAAPAPSSGSERQSSRGSRKAKRTGSNVFSMFTQKQVAEFKEVRNTLHSDALIIASLNIYVRVGFCIGTQFWPRPYLASLSLDFRV